MKARLMGPGWRFTFPMLVIALLLAAWPQGAALAHANLVSSEPARGAVLPTPPGEIVLNYSEELDPAFTSVNLADVTGKTVVAGPGVIAPRQPRTLRLKLTPLPNGVYSAIWVARSAVDGHETYGTVSFSVGESSPRASLLPPPGAPDPAIALPPPLDAGLRWLNIAAAALAVGGVMFGLAIWRPVYRLAHPDAPHTPADEALSALLRRLTLIGLGTLAVATVGLLLAQVIEAAPGANLADALARFAATRTGLLFAARLLLTGLMASDVLGIGEIGSGSPRRWWLAAALCTGIVATFSLQSHAAALSSITGTALDWLHFAAVSVWMGGLLPLAVAMYRTRTQGEEAGYPALSALVPRFSWIALSSMTLIVLTGVYNGFLLTRTLDAVTDTSYGRVLLVKFLIVMVLVALGAINLKVLTPRLAHAGLDAARWLGRTVRLELALGVGVLLAAGLLTSLAPAYDALQAQQRLGFTGWASEDGVNLTLRIAPVKVGEDEFGVDVDDTRPGASANPATVLLRIKTLDQDLGLTEVQMASAGGQRYTARGAYFAQAGNWAVDVIVRRPGFNDVRHRFTLALAGAPVVATPAPVESTRPNPIPADAASIARGKALYTANCLPCHGAGGKGDGPVGLTLNPRPADLTKHTVPGVHTDGQLWKWITSGYPKSSMPAFDKLLSDSDRWDLVNYIRTLAQPQ